MSPATEVLKDAGYTVHGPNEADASGETKWAFCIDGDYSEEFEDEDAAWLAAAADFAANRYSKDPE